MYIPIINMNSSICAASLAVANLGKDAIHSVMLIFLLNTKIGPICGNHPPNGLAMALFSPANFQIRSDRLGSTTNPGFVVGYPAAQSTYASDQCARKGRVVAVLAQYNPY